MRHLFDRHVFKKGSKEELRELIRLFLLTDPDVWDGPSTQSHDHSPGNYLYIMSALGSQQAYCVSDNPRVRTLIDHALKDHVLIGPYAICYKIADLVGDATPRDRMVAVGQLRKWLKRRRLSVKKYLGGF